jgi:MoaA/NifB/PqqE/SkfB family radical SAM enzyme
VRAIWEWDRANGIIPYIDFLYTYRDNDLYGVSEDEMDKLRESIYAYDKSLGYEYKPKRGPHIGHRKCNTNIGAIIGVNGEVRICPAVDIYVGDVREKSLKEILEEKKKVEKEIRFECVDRGMCGAYRLEERLQDSGKGSIRRVRP